MIKQAIGFAFILFLFATVDLCAQEEQDILLIDSLYQLSGKQDGREKIETLLQLSEAYRLVSFDKSLKTGEDAMALSDKEGYQGLKGKILKSLGVSAYYIGDYDLALRYYDMSINAYRQQDDLKGVASCLHNKALIYEITGRFDSAIIYYLNSLAMEEKLGDLSGQGMTILNIGNLHYQQGNYSQALDNYYRAGLIVKDLPDTLLLGQILQNTGLVYWQWDQNDQALEKLFEARELFEQSGEEWELANVNYHLGLMYAAELDQPDKGMEYYLKALDMKQMLGDPAGSARVLNSIGDLLSKQLQHEKAFEYFAKSLRIYETLGHASGLVETWYFMGKAYQAAGQIVKSIEAIEKSLNLSVQYEMHVLVEECNEIMMENFALIGNKQAFSYYFKLVSDSQDSTISQLKKLNMSEARLKYVLQNMESDFQILEKDNKQMQLELRYYRWALSVLSALLLLIFIGLLIQRKRFSNQRNVS